MSKVMMLNEDSFKDEVINSKGIVVVNFWSTSCMPCKMFAPILDEVSERATFKIGKINVDENPSLTIEYGIRAIPATLIFKDGEKIDQIMGFTEKEKLLEKVEGVR